MEFLYKGVVWITLRHTQLFICFSWTRHGMNNLIFISCWIWRPFIMVLNIRWYILTYGPTWVFYMFLMCMILGFMSKAFSPSKHIINSLNGYVILTPLVWTLIVLQLWSIDSSCLPITDTKQSTTLYFGSHTSLVWFLTNTLCPTLNSGVINVRNISPCPSLDSLILWITCA